VALQPSGVIDGQLVGFATPPNAIDSSVSSRGITPRNPFLPQSRRSKSGARRRQVIGLDPCRAASTMLETVIVLLILLWAFGFWGPYHAHLGNFVHVLILLAVVVLIIRLIQGRRVL
jgi:hypothetical protein